jgi:hypothetical protein
LIRNLKTSYCKKQLHISDARGTNQIAYFPFKNAALLLKGQQGQ